MPSLHSEQASLQGLHWAPSLYCPFGHRHYDPCRTNPFELWQLWQVVAEPEQVVHARSQGWHELSEACQNCPAGHILLHSVPLALMPRMQSGVGPQC